MVRMSTLCYIEDDGRYLMLHRVVKENDINRNKWIGVGGKFEYAESPDECIKREVLEETGCTLTSYRPRGIVTFVYGGDTVEYMHLFTADGFTGDMHECDEGVLEWVEREKVKDLELWEGDRIFLKLFDERDDFFSLKLVYDTDDVLERAELDGEELELFDILDENGRETGRVRERGVAHMLGTPHRTVHVWIVRPDEKGCRVLLQTRSEEKDSNPGCLDISAAGHIPHGEKRLTAAVRETCEETGILFSEKDFDFVGTHHGHYEAEFHGKPFLDDEFMDVYIVTEDFDDSSLVPQEHEVDSFEWADLGEVRRIVIDRTRKNCMYPEELGMVEGRLRERGLIR